MLLTLNVLWQISTLALVAFGLAVIFGQLRIINMAHGEFVMIGAYTAPIVAALGLPPLFQPLVCLGLAGVLALAIEYFFVRHLYNRLFDSLLATWAIGILLRELAIVFFGRAYQNVASPVPGTADVLGTDYPMYRLLLMAFILVFFCGFYAWYRRSYLGMKIRAMVENPPLASAMGTNVPALSRRVFIAGSMSAAFAGWLLAPTVRIDPFMGLDYLVRSFFALVVGGAGSLQGLVVGSGIIGGLQSVISALMNQVSGYVFVLLLSILFLWKRPNGIVNPR